MRRSPPRAILLHATTGLLLVALALTPAALAQAKPRSDSTWPSVPARTVPAGKARPAVSVAAGPSIKTTSVSAPSITAATGPASIKASAAASGAPRSSPLSRDAAPARPAARLVRVEPGQNLYRIALAAGLPVDVLMRANGIESPDILEAGRMLVIPEGGHPSAPASPPVVSAPRAASPAPSVAARAGKGSGGASALSARTVPSALETSPPGPVPGLTASIAAAAPAGRLEPVGPDDAPSGASLFVLPPSDSFLWPVAGGLTRSGFGQRHGRLHAGLDISAPTGFDVLAAREGTVVYSGNKFQGYGNVVMVDHGDGYVTVYAHNAENLVEEGDAVDRGEVIAKVGATGNATGSHCHFEVRKDNVAIDPLRFFRTDPDAGVVAGAAVERSPSRVARSRAASGQAAPPIP